MGDILKEAIADAKAVRETALQNAKMALEEAFTPQLKSMLSAKLKEDDMESEEDPVLAPEEEFGEEEPELSPEEPVVAPEEGDYGMGEDEFGGEEEIPAEEGDYGMGEEEPEISAEVPGEEEEGDLDLEAVIRELEQSLTTEEDLGNGDPDEKDNAYEEDGEYDIKNEVTLNGKVYRLVNEADVEDTTGDVKASTQGVEETDNAYDEEDPGDDEKHQGGEIGESFDLDSSLFEEEEEDDEEETVDEQSDSSDIGKGDNVVNVADSSDEEDAEGGAGVEQKKMGESVRQELRQYKEAVKFLKDKLHEVNILNAKLLFTNKLFKEFALDNGQKLKVVETFDRAQSTREIKLVYSTLAEQFGDNGSINRKKSITESASTAVSSTKPSKGSRKVISEENEVANRFKKLAGIIKG